MQTESISLELPEEKPGFFKRLATKLFGWFPVPVGWRMWKNSSIYEEMEGELFLREQETRYLIEMCFAKEEEFKNTKYELAKLISAIVTQYGTVTLDKAVIDYVKENETKLLLDVQKNEKEEIEIRLKERATENAAK